MTRYSQTHLTEDELMHRQTQPPAELAPPAAAPLNLQLKVLQLLCNVCLVGLHHTAYISTKDTPYAQSEQLMP